jgi:biopolymer transport protein ExbB/TolQ
MAKPGAAQPLLSVAPRSGLSFALGFPLALLVLGSLYAGPLRQSVLHRYVSHPVECVEVLMFCCAVCGLAAKWHGATRQKRAFYRLQLPVAATGTFGLDEVGTVLHETASWPAPWRATWLGHRIVEILTFVKQRRSVRDLDDFQRALADNDALALDSGYGLLRFITWAIPILGFLGTVLGITGAISGVTPEVLEKSLSTVTDGLALAFDATALGLALTMATMFLTFLVERREQGLLERVDRWVEVHLANRIERAVPLDGTSETLRQHMEYWLATVDRSTQMQIETWKQAILEVQRQQAESHRSAREQMAGALMDVIQQSAQAHTDRLAELERSAVSQVAKSIDTMSAQAAAVLASAREQQTAMTALIQKFAEQAQNVGRLQDWEKELIGVQQSLTQNLQALTASGAFQDAVHSLTAAIHLLTSRAAGSLASQAEDRLKLRKAG